MNSEVECGLDGQTVVREEAVLSSIFRTLLGRLYTANHGHFIYAGEM